MDKNPKAVPTHRNQGMPQLLHSEQYGHDGPTVLLLHGLGSGASIWTEVAKKLAHGRRVLVPDLLGFGRSPWPDVAYTVDDHLAALESLLDQCGLSSQQLDIAGHSMGAILAVEFAARHPDLVRHLALVSMPYFTSKDDVICSAKRLGLLASLTVEDHWAAKITCGVMCALRPVLAFLAPHLTKRVPARVVKDAFLHNYNSYSGSLRNVILNHRPDRALIVLAERPVLLLHGESDQVVPLEKVSYLDAQFACWRLKVLSRAGHLLPVELPEETAALLEHFFSVPCGVDE